VWLWLLLQLRWLLGLRRELLWLRRLPELLRRLRLRLLLLLHARLATERGRHAHPCMRRRRRLSRPMRHLNLRRGDYPRLIGMFGQPRDRSLHERHI
jgi:hypothetical protein